MASFKLLFMSITNKCDRSCDYCPIATWRNSKIPEFGNFLTLQDCMEVINQTNPTHVEVTGGEPTLVPWLDELLDFLESKGIIYLVKSNGYKKCRNQITAWHDSIENPPANFDKILIIRKNGWEDKEKYCIEHNIPCGVIGFNDIRIYNISEPRVQTLFLCPNGKIKSCAAAGQLSDMDNPWEKKKCKTCKAVDDFLIFLPATTSGNNRGNDAGDG